jgi:outer membrane protein assembly factor BamB
VRVMSRLNAILPTFLIAALVLLAGCDDTTAQRQGPASGQGPAAPGAADATPAVVVPTVPADGEDWPLELRDLSKSGSSPDAELTPPLALAWKFRTGAAVVGGPVVARDTVYMGSKDGRLYALEADRWGERWRFRASGEIHASPAYADGVVVFTDTKGKLYGVNAATGDLLWDKTLHSVTSSSPVFADGRVWLGMHPDKVVAFDRGTGAELRTSRVRATIGGVAYATANGVLRPEQPITAAVPTTAEPATTRSQPVRAGGMTYMGYQDGTLRAFNASGVETWTATLPAAVEGTPAIADGKLYVPCADGSLYVFVNEDAAPAPPPPDRDTVTITQWETRTHSRPDASAVMDLVLNSDTDLGLLERSDGWAHVELPNGDPAWIAPGGWAVLSDAGRNAPFRENRSVAAVERTIDLPDGAEKPLWSPDGSTVAFMLRRDLRGRFWQAQGVWLFDVAERRTQSIAHGAFFSPYMSWSLDGQWVAFERYEGDVPVVEIAGADTPTPKLIAEGTAPAWSPRAHRLAFFRPFAEGEELWRINSDRTGAELLLELPAEGYLDDYRPTRAAAWTAAGDRVAVGADSRHYDDDVARLIIKAPTGEAEATTIATPAKQFRGLSWSPDGEKIACVLAGHLGGSLGDPLDQRVTVYWPDQSHAPVSASHAAARWVGANHLAYVELPTTAGAPSKVWLLDVMTEERTLLLYASEPVTSLAWIAERDRLCVWSTSDYLRDGKYQPARTRGWLVRVEVPPAT